MFAPLVAKVPISPSSKLMLQRSTLVAQRSGDIAFEHGHTLHRSVGKQAAPILLAQHIGSPTENECHDQAEEGVKGAAQQPPVASLDFSKISIYPRNQAEQSQKRSPLSLPQLVSPRTSAIAQAIHEAIVENSGAVPPTQDALSDALALVRMRDDACADRAAHLLGAQAFAFGNQILFRHGNYEPDTERGRALIVHELTHVVHQTQTGYFRPQRLVGGDVLSVQFTHAMAEAMTNEELSQQILLLRSHLQSEPDDAGAAENLAVLESVAYSRQAVPSNVLSQPLRPSRHQPLPPRRDRRSAARSNTVSSGGGCTAKVWR